MIGGKVTAAKVRAKVAAEERGWCLRNLAKSGMVGMVTVRGYREAAKYIEHNGYVWLDQRGEDYLIGILEV